MRQPSVHVRLDLSLVLATPLSVGASGSRGGIADKEIQRDGWHRPIIPGSQVKGHLRHACERLAHELGCPHCLSPYPGQMCPYSEVAIERCATEPLPLKRLPPGQPAYQCLICALFGSPTYPGPLHFSPLIHQPSGSAVPPEAPLPLRGRLRTGVGMDRYRRTAAEKILYTTETTEAGLRFQGTIEGHWWESAEAEVQPLLGLLVGGIALCERWGGGSSRGLGWAAMTSEIRVNGQPVERARLLSALQAEVAG